jgi:hypothetical protein
MKTTYSPFFHFIVSLAVSCFFIAGVLYVRTNHKQHPEYIMVIIFLFLLQYYVVLPYLNKKLLF